MYSHNEYVYKQKKKELDEAILLFLAQTAYFAPRTRLGSSSGMCTHRIRWWGLYIYTVAYFEPRTRLAISAAAGARLEYAGGAATYMYIYIYVYVYIYIYICRCGER